MFKFPLIIPQFHTLEGFWTTKVIETKEAFIELAKVAFKTPGEYDLANTDRWRQAAYIYEQNGTYCDFIPNTPQYDRFWRAEMAKCVSGIFVDGDYIPGIYYFYLNYCPIYNKKERNITFPEVWDSDYRFFIYILLCILMGKHAIVVKTRQRGYSYKIMSILLWSYWWFKGSINTIGASDEEFTQKSWEYLNQYRNHLNTKTAWSRGPQIPKNLDWIERTMTEDGYYIGNDSKLKGLTFKQSPTKGVGGAQSFFFYEEAGIAPTLLSTIEYIKPAIQAGNLVTGTIIVSGSVGELDQCEDLRKLFENPEANGFLGVPNIWEEDSPYDKVGFFVPDSWSLEGYIDSNGNSKVQEAEGFILSEREKSRQGKAQEKYQLSISQSPLTPGEAFAFRKKSFFPQGILAKQEEAINITKPKITPVVLYEDNVGKVKWRIADNDGDSKPIKVFPIPDSTTDIRGCVEIEEFPEVDEPAFLQYFAGVDPISTDKTTTSESLFSIHIFKSLTEIKYVDDEDGKVKTKVTGFKPVAWYVGRMEDLKQTNTIAEHLIRMYNAFTICESNVQTFINHMQGKQLQRYLATKQEIGFLEDIKANQHVHKMYGAHMTPNIKSYILQNIKDYISEEIDFVRKKDSDEIIKTIYGVERINDIALLQEARKYREGLNTDRLISFGLALSLAKHYMVNGIFSRINKTEEKNERVMMPSRSYFKTMDGNLNNVATRKKSYFKNYG